MKFLNQMHDQVNLLTICISLSASEEWQIQTMSGESVKNTVIELDWLKKKKKTC